MALIIENGSIVENANAFVSVDEARLYASVRGIILPELDSTIEASIIKATDYIKSIRNRFKGQEIVIEQALPFPRYNVYVNGFNLPSNIIPRGIKDACCQLTIESSAGLDLMPTTTGQITITEAVGPLEVEYAENSSADGTLNFNAANALLKPYFKGGGGGGGLTSSRI